MWPKYLPDSFYNYIMMLHVVTSTQKLVSNQAVCELEFSHLHNNIFFAFSESYCNLHEFLTLELQ